MTLPVTRPPSTLNVRNVLNRERGGDIPVDGYRHRALFDREWSRLEMPQVAGHTHRVYLHALDTSFQVAAGEEIPTEISRKVSREDISALLGGVGLNATEHFEYGPGDYSLVLAERG